MPNHAVTALFVAASDSVLYFGINDLRFSGYTEDKR
jgi:hypothetical protein